MSVWQGLSEGLFAAVCMMVGIPIVLMSIVTLAAAIAYRAGDMEWHELSPLSQTIVVTLGWHR